MNDEKDIKMISDDDLGKIAGGAGTSSKKAYRCKKCGQVKRAVIIPTSCPDCGGEIETESVGLPVEKPVTI